MSRHKFPASLPRNMYWSDAVRGCGTCPDCHAALECEQHTYVLATRRAGEFGAHVVGNRAGHFCGSCPVVVLDRDEFERFVFLSVGDADGVDYAIMGIVDLDAVPPDKRNLPFDDDTNPIPLVMFTNMGEAKSEPSSHRKKRNRTKRRNRKRKR